MKYYISIHDITPDNLKNVEKIKDLLQKKYNIKKICLLIIPGLNWKSNQINKIKKWQNSNCEIAAHGWIHKTGKKRTLYHIFHSLIISGDCAEHLSINKDCIIQIINKSYNWFFKNNFDIPNLYVAPAWALGNINNQDLIKLPFNTFESTTGITKNGKYIFLPLIGFKSNNYFRALLQKFANYLNFQFAKFVGVIRISLHPDDLNLYLSNDIHKYLSLSKKTILLSEL